MIDPERWTRGHEEWVHVWETVVVTMVTLCNRNHSTSTKERILYTCKDLYDTAESTTRNITQLMELKVLHVVMYYTYYNLNHSIKGLHK